MFKGCVEQAGGANKDRRRAELYNAMSLLGGRPLFEGSSLTLLKLGSITGQATLI